LDRAEVVRELNEGAIADSGWLKPGGRAELEAALARWESQGLRAKIVLLPEGSNPRPWRSLWADLGLDERVDLLLIYAGDHWEARGWGLDDAEIAQALDAAEPALAEYAGKGLVAALDGLGAASLALPSGGSVPVRRRSASGLPGVTELLVAGVGAGTLAAGALGWLIWRRQKLAREDKGRLLADQRAAAEVAYANLILDADQLGPDSFDLQQRAARLRRELDLVARNEGDESVRLGKMRQVENEIAALQSTVLQRKRER
jgi:hypothetical protein